jgi:lipopolysaccharide export system permease protein
MRLHDRYFFRELLTPLAGCLGGFLIFWFSFFFFTHAEEIRNAKLDAKDAAEYCLAGLPEFFILALPVLLLLALLYALTHHAKHNEITALRAAGVGLWRLCGPYFLVGLLATAFYFALNEIAVPAGQNWSADILTRHVHTSRDVQVKTQFSKVGFHCAQTKRTWYISGYDSVTTTMTGLDVRWLLPDGTQRQLVAERGVWQDNVWVFTNVQQFVQSGSRITQLPRTNLLAMPEFSETPKQVKLEAKFSEANGLLASRSADIPLADLWPYLRQNPDLTGKDGPRLLTKFHARLSAPWTCLIVVLMAIPFGAQTGRRNLFFGVAGSIFICFAFFILQQVSLGFGMSGRVPSWLAAWLPNFIFAATGFFLTQRTR